MSNYRQFAKLMVLMQEVFVPQKPISKEKIEIYYRFLEKYTIKEITESLEKIMKTKRYSTFPLPAEIMSNIEMTDSDEIFELDGMDLWNKACEMIVIGAREGESDILFLDETIRLTFGSWQKFGQTNPDYEQLDRKRFVECYKRIRENHARKELPETSILEELIETREKIKKLKQ